MENPTDTVVTDHPVRVKIFADIETEREYQDAKWGQDFDGKNTINDWGTFIGIYTANACGMNLTPAAQRAQLVKVAAIAVAAIEQVDKLGAFALRHYDKPQPVTDPSQPPA